MTDRPRGEVPQTEQLDEHIRQELERELKNLKVGKFSPIDLEYTLESIGETRFLPALIKIELDQTVELFRQRLENGNPMETQSVAGHQGMHTANFYSWSQQSSATDMMYPYAKQLCPSHGR
jgi:hypothetical protein